MFGWNDFKKGNLLQVKEKGQFYINAVKIHS